MRRRRSIAGVAADLTPMVDVVFLLIVFFVLVAQISGAERVPMTLPELDPDSSAQQTEEAGLIINVTPDPGAPGGARIRMGLRRFDADERGLERLSDALERRLAHDPQLATLIRAPRDAALELVQPVLRACSRAGASNLDVAAAPNPGPADE